MYKCLEHIKILRWIKLTYCIVVWAQPWNRQLQESARTGSDIVAQCGRKKEAGGASAAETWCVTMHCSELVFFFFLVHRICPSNVLFWLHSLYCMSNLIYNVKKKAEYSWMWKNERLLMLWLTPAFFKWNCPLLVKDGDTWRQVEQLFTCLQWSSKVPWPTERLRVVRFFSELASSPPLLPVVSHRWVKTVGGEDIKTERSERQTAGRERNHDSFPSVIPFKKL